MNWTYEDFGRLGTEWTNAGTKSFAALSKGAQAIAAEASEYTRRHFEAGSAVVEDVLSAKSVEGAIDIQAAFARQSYEAFIAEAARIGDLYAELAKETYKPFESITARAQ